MPNAVVLFCSSTDTSLEEGKITKDFDISTVNAVLHVQDGLLKI